MWQQRYRTIGEVRATRYVELRTEVDGKISDIGFVGGSPVVAGQSLLVLDSTEERAQLRATHARLKLAELQLKRIGELRAKKLASENEYDSAEADEDILQANVASLVARIEKKSLFAPFDAQTGLHTLQIGQYLPANAVITELTGGVDELWIDFNLPQGKASLPIDEPVQVSSRSFRAGPLTATVISAAASLNLQSRSRSYRALLTHPPEAIRPGSVVDVQMVTGSIDGVFRLSSSAVRRNSFGAFVYVLEKAEEGAIAEFRAVRRQVTVGPGDGEEIFVTNGLKPGERVAAIGAFKLLDGMLTHVAKSDPIASGETPPGSEK
ncbi:MAG: membrane fusion protein (multidrug efflux system) [Bacteroidia bacterium]|jgi:membrane fusion protein (multidrug efflux system)